MHNRWECPAQRTHYLSNDQICSMCRCYVCNIALQICGVNSHKWAAPPSVLDWEKLRPRHQPWEPFTGQELCVLHFPVVFVNNDIMLNRTGVESATVVRYMSQPVNATLWYYLKDAVHVHNVAEINTICGQTRDTNILCYMGHESYMSMAQQKGNLIMSLQWKDAVLELIIRLRRTAWDTSFLRPYLRLAVEPRPARPFVAAHSFGERELFPHQKEALRDMLYVERYSVTHALWTTTTIPHVYVQRFTPEDLNHTYNESRMNLYLKTDDTPVPDSMVHGGFLCNDRGTGKTFVTAALIAAHAAHDVDDATIPEVTSKSDSDDEDVSEPVTREKPIPVAQTLILVPTANLLQQWVEELELQHLKVFIHHGKTRIHTLEDLQAHDVILTTFDTFRALFYGPHITVFHRVMFWRVVIDECHRLLQGQSFTRAGMAVVQLQARNRWGLTATPDATFSRMRVLTQLIAGPVYNKKYLVESSLIHRFIENPDRYNEQRRIALFTKLVIKYEAEAHVMPNVHIQQLAVPLENPSQYEQIINRVRRIGTAYGGVYLMRVFNNILATINGVGPMKWPATQPAEANNQYAELPADVYDCSICLDVLRRPMRSACQHYFCHTCITQWLQTAANCPLCRSAARPLVPCLEIVADADGPDDSTLQPSSAKAAFLVQLAEHILALPDDQGEPHRILVFSRYVQMRQLLIRMLAPHATADVGEFQAGGARVLVMSFLNGSVGLNLMQANHVILCEPCFRTSTEEQAYGRAARLGQRRDVHVYLVHLQNTIEEAMTRLPRNNRLSIEQAFA